jgi:hypothetical protein
MQPGADHANLPETLSFKRTPGTTDFVEMPCYCTEQGFDHTRLAVSSEDFDAAKQLLRSVFKTEARQKMIELINKEKAEAWTGSPAISRRPGRVVLRFEPDKPGAEPVAAAVYSIVGNETEIRVHFISTKLDVSATRTKSSVKMRNKGHATKVLEFIQDLHPALGWSVVVANEQAALGFWRKNGLDFAGGSAKAAIKHGGDGHSILMVCDRQIRTKLQACEEAKQNISNEQCASTYSASSSTNLQKSSSEEQLGGVDNKGVLLDSKNYDTIHEFGEIELQEEDGSWRSVEISRSKHQTNRSIVLYFGQDEYEGLAGDYQISGHFLQFSNDRLLDGDGEEIAWRQAPPAC